MGLGHLIEKYTPWWKSMSLTINHSFSAFSLTILSLALILARNRLEGSFHKSGRHVGLGLAPAELSLQGPEGVREGPSAGPVAQPEVEGGEDGVDDGPLGAKGHGDEPQHGHEKLRHQRGEKLGQDDGGEHHDKRGDEGADLVEALRANGVVDLVEVEVEARHNLANRFG